MGSMKHALGLDLGGSSAKLAIVSGSGEVLAEDSDSIDDAGQAEAVLNPVAAAISRLQEVARGRGVQIVALGCGFSGYLDDTRTRVEQNNTAALNGFALQRWLQTASGLEVTIDNDACVAAIAETRLSPLVRGRRVLFVTVGSGIGVVLVVDGIVARLLKGITGDAGHLIVNRGSAMRCPYGCYGCLETVASARAIAHAGQAAAEDGSSAFLAAIAARGNAVSGRDVALAARSGDATARAILVSAGEWLGIGLASLSCVYVPDTILLGGAVSQAGDAWLDAAVAAMRGTGMPYCGDLLNVAPAVLGNRAGVIGAALVALEGLGEGAPGGA
jgi:glucokinase